MVVVMEALQIVSGLLCGLPGTKLTTGEIAVVVIMILLAGFGSILTIIIQYNTKQVMEQAIQEAIPMAQQNTERPCRLTNYSVTSSCV
ncbi:hypothetical protein X777_11963 [Ooceraea biroi]|uniref:Uncharacterized protein n=1 Tax=Ooceraea biroi TaxID=2015173 RepID=A0A026W167_OOCBI|nr:hypothetical protein X777_11963 [Ooceraea biroi]